VAISQIRKRLGNWLSRKFPSFYYRAISGPKVRKRFALEKQLAAGAKLSRSVRTSILFFTTQKCASRHVNSVLGSLIAGTRLVHADYDAYLTTAYPGKHLNPFDPAGTLSLAFHPKGYYYGPIGSYREIPNADKYKIVLQLRDPRDMLTSLYYSTAYSHELINEKMVQRRLQALKQTVDEYVLSSAPDYVSIYERYIAKLLLAEHVLFLKYEEMVSDFPVWLDRLTQHCGLSDQVNAIAQIKKEADFKVEREDVYSQRRQVTPGDYHRKLKSETVEQLNSMFSRVLEQLNYQ
jgi:hypothetical protein